MLEQLYGVDRTCDAVPPMLDYRVNVHHEGLKNVEYVGAPAQSSAASDRKTSFGKVSQSATWQVHRLRNAQLSMESPSNFLVVVFGSN